MIKLLKSTPGKIIAIAILLAILVLVIYFQGDNKERLGTFERTAEGGIFDNEVISFSFSAAPNALPSDVDIFRKHCNKEVNPGINYESNYAYQLQGDAGAFTGTLTVRMPLPEAVLKNADSFESLTNRLFIVAEEQAITPHLQTVFTTNTVLKTTIDPATNTAVAEFTFDGLRNTETDSLFDAMRESIPSSFFSKNDEAIDFTRNTFAINDEFSIAFHLRSYNQPVVQLHTSPPNNQETPLFELFIDQKVNELNLAELIDILEKQTVWLQQLGFSFEHQQLPIQVKLTNLSSEKARYVKPQGFEGRSYIEVDVNPYLVSDWERYADSKKWTELKAATGHSLIHLLQDSYKKNRLDWFDEATACWYEVVSVQKSAYLPEDVAENLSFFEVPLLHRETLSEDEQNWQSKMDYGKGLSVFFAHLSATNNATFISSLYGQCAENTQCSPENMIIKTLDGKTLADIYPAFADAFFRAPQGIFPALQTTTIDEIFPDDEVQAEIAPEDDSFRVEWTINTANNEAVAQNNQLTYTLKNLTAKTFKATFDVDDDVPRDSLTLKITLTGDSRTGVFLYIPSGNDNWTPLLGSGFFLAPDTQSSIALGAFPDLYGVVFNANDNFSLPSIDKTIDLQWVVEKGKADIYLPASNVAEKDTDTDEEPEM